MVPTEEIEKIIKQLKDMEDELAKLEGEVTDISQMVDDDLADQMRDFAKGFKGEQLFEANRGLKQVEGLLSQLDKKWRAVNGNNEEFMGVLDRANNDEDDKARVELIELLLKESTEDSKASLDEIKQEKDQMKELIERMRAKLRSMDAASADMKELNEIFKDTATCTEVIEKKLKELDQIDDDVEERKKRWTSFDAESGQRDGMMEDLQGLLSANEELYK